MHDAIRVLVVGTGQMGSGVARLVLEKDGLDLVGAYGRRRGRAGVDIGEAIGLDRRLGIALSADLDAEIASRQRADPQNIFAYLPLMYWRAMLNGKGKLGQLVNSRYPQIRPLTVREYVKREAL